tara:strand:+ start:18445 stop:18714 length:270 start_codon:yes stop_codon:yes gene_type:complete
MPKYYYKCDVCLEQWTEWCSMTEERTACALCGSKQNFYKVPQPFSSNATHTGTSKKIVGDETKKGIEENREILKQMQDIARTRKVNKND